jgi:hypothetical protein
MDVLSPLFEINILSSIVVSPFSSIIGLDPDTVRDPVISALPLLDPSHSPVTPVNNDPSPVNDPENIEAEIADVTAREPDIDALPVCCPVQVVATPVNCDPSPVKDPVKDPVRILPEACVPFRFRLVRLEPFPVKDPLNDPETPDASLRSTVPPFTSKDPVIFALPVYCPFQVLEAVM